jgi:Alpha-L-arabinofuranosidase B (ABFB) domain
MPGGPVSFPGAAGASASGRSEHDTVPLQPVPAEVPAAHRQPGGTAGRHRALVAASRKWPIALAVYRSYIAIGAASVIVTLAGGVALLVLPDHSKALLASKCRPGGCHQIVPRAPETVLPVTAPATAHMTSTALPSPGSATATEVDTGQAAATAPAASPAPSATPTQPKPSPTSTAPGLTPGSWISIRATTACCTSFYIRHDDSDSRVVITQITSGSSATIKADATWIVRAGLANSSCISFESANDPPGHFLRHYDFELYLDPDDGSAQFAQDATFCPEPGTAARDTRSSQSTIRTSTSATTTTSPTSPATAAPIHGTTAGSGPTTLPGWSASLGR